MTNGELLSETAQNVYNGPVDDHVALHYLLSNIVKCEDCKYLRVINDGKTYAVCEETGFMFMPCGTDPAKHFCAYGEKED